MIGNHGKLTEERAEVIKSLLNAGEHTHRQIAHLAMDIWGISISREMITKINLGMRWNEEKRSFKMKKKIKKEYSGPQGGKKTGIKSNDFRQFTPTNRALSQEDINTIKGIISKMEDND